MSVYVLLGRKDSMEAILEVECRYKLIDASAAPFKTIA